AGPGLTRGRPSALPWRVSALLRSQGRSASRNGALRFGGRGRHCSISADLVRLDIELTREPCVFFGIGPGDASELLRAAADGLGRGLQQALAAGGIGERLVHLGIEARDRRSRRSPGHERGRPRLERQAPYTCLLP